MYARERHYLRDWKRNLMCILYIHIIWQAKDPKIVAATAEYGVTIHASVEKENVFACQFHPEKSSKTGLAILKNFLAQRRKG